MVIDAKLLVHERFGRMAGSARFDGGVQDRQAKLDQDLKAKSRGVRDLPEKRVGCRNCLFVR